MIKKFLKKSYLLIGFVIFVWIIKDLNFSEFINSLSKINLFYFGLAFILYLPVTALKSYRWKKIIEIQGLSYSFKDAFYVYNSSLLLGLITPGRLGDASKIFYLKKDKQPLSRAIFGVLFDKLSDLVFICLFLVLCLPFLPLIPHFSVNYSTFLFFSLIIIVTTILFLALLYFKKNSRLRLLTINIIKEFKKFKVRDNLYLLFLTAAPWFIYFLMIYLIAASVGINNQIGFFYLAFSAALITVAALLPVSVLGIGTREVALIFFLTPLGLNKEIIILFSLLVTFNYLSLFFICLYTWFKKPMI